MATILEEKMTTQTTTTLHDTLRYMLKSTLELFHTHNIEHCLIYGTLLGYYRDNDIIPHDDDCDLLVPKSYFNQVLELKNLFKNQYDLKLIHVPDNYKLLQICCYDPNINKLQKQKHGQVDLYFFDIDSSGYLLDMHNHWRYPSSYVLPFQKTQFLNQPTYCAVKTKEFLERVYGKDFMTPIKGKKTPHHHKPMINGYRTFF